MKFLAVVLFCCGCIGALAQATTQIDPNNQIGGPLLSTNLMLPGVAADGANGVAITGGLLVSGIPQSTSPICPNGLNGALTTAGCASGSGSFTALTGDAVSTSSGGATMVKGLNGVLLSGLATGVLYNTTATGAPTIATAAQVNALLQGLTGCTTATWLLSPQDAQCHAPSGGSMTWPAAAGIVVYAGASTWGTSLTAPAGTIIGTTDTQTLTNKTVDGVTPATMAFMDATSSVQTQLNGKQATLTNPVTGPGAATVGHVALLNNTSGTLLSDGGAPPGIASAGTLGLVKPDGTTITNTSGAISVTYGTTAASATVGNDTRVTGAMPKSGGTFTGEVITLASAVGTAGFNLPHGAAPTAPVNGDLWTTTAGVFARINGATTGPLGSGGSMTWPAGGAGIPNYNGSSAWGTSYSSGSTIPANFIATIPNTQISGLGTASTQNIGTSGANVPLLSTQNVWTTHQFSGGLLQANGVGPSLDATDGTKILYTTGAGWLASGASDTLHFGNGNLTAGGLPSVDFGGFDATGIFTFASSPILPGTGYVFSPGGSAQATYSASIPLSGISTQASDTVVANFTASTAAPSAVAMPTTGTNGCAGATNALTYNTTTHALGCNTISGGSITFPQTVTGGVAWAVPYFSATTTMDHNAAPTLNNGPLLGQTAAAPVWSAISFPVSSSAGGITYGSSSTALSVTAAITPNALIRINGTTPAASSLLDNTAVMVTTEPLYSTNGNQLTGTTATSIATTTYTTTGIAFPATYATTARTYRGLCHVSWEQAIGVATVKFGVGTSVAPTHMSLTSVSYVGTTAVPFGTGTTDITTITTTDATAFLTPGAAATAYVTDIYVTASFTAAANTVTLYGQTSNVSDALLIEPGTECTWLP